MKPIRLYLSILLCLLYACTQQESQNTIKNFVTELEVSLENNIIKKWYPQVIDSVQGGYLSGFDEKWEIKENQDKSLVYEARHLWATSFIYNHYNADEDFLKYQKQGFDFLNDFLWDKEFGGFYYMVNREGIPLEQMIHEKRIYGQAFALYALSEYYSAVQDSAALELAKSIFNWMEIHAHDRKYGGYYEFLLRDGTPIQEEDQHVTSLHDKPAIGYKDYNSSIHILEALSSFYTVYRDTLVKKRLTEMFYIIRDTMVADKGYLQLYFHRNWELVTNETLKVRSAKDSWFTPHITFGHDIETAYLLLEAAEILGIHDEKTDQIVKRLVEHTLLNGWDDSNGGIFEKGIYNDQNIMVITDHHKAWWSQVEALNSLSIMYTKYPDDPMDYQKYMLAQWQHINSFLIDHDNGGWYNNSIDTSPDSKDADKAHNWKTSYHTSRGMINSINNLKKYLTTFDSY